MAFVGHPVDLAHSRHRLFPTGSASSLKSFHEVAAEFRRSQRARRSLADRMENVCVMEPVTGGGGGEGALIHSPFRT